MEKLAIFDVDEEMGAKAVEHFYQTCDSSGNSTGNDSSGSGGDGVEEGKRLTVIFRKVDVSDETAVDEAVKDVVEQFDGVDILLCFAGISESKLSIEYDIESWRRIFDVNLHGCFLVARAFARYLFPSLFFPFPFFFFFSFLLCFSPRLTPTLS